MSWHKICDDRSPNSNQEVTPTSNIINNSDASSVDDANTELGTEDAFTYLSGLNSDNLMQFSQQSILQEMMIKEQLDIKPNLNVLPTFEEHDNGGYKFQLKLPALAKGRSSYNYSESLNKIYIRMNDIFSIDAEYKPKWPPQQLRVRVFMCFLKEVSEPVLRCQNHISKDPETNITMRHSILRCQNPIVEYCGSEEGKSINDRYSILIPLSLKPISKDDTVKETIAFKFTCQNSCIGRKETSLIFLLEGMNGEILSQRELDVKICSCPKRDRIIDEGSKGTKRKMSDVSDFNVHKAKKMKNKLSRFIKEESTDEASEHSDSDHNRNRLECDAQLTASGGIRVVVEFCNKDIGLLSILTAANAVSAEIVNEPNQINRYLPNYRQLKRLHEKIKKL